MEGEEEEEEGELLHLISRRPAATLQHLAQNLYFLFFFTIILASLQEAESVTQFVRLPSSKLRLTTYKLSVRRLKIFVSVP